MSANVNVVVFGSQEFPNVGAPPLLHADKLTVGLKIESALHHQVSLNELVVEHPVVHVQVNRDGKALQNMFNRDVERMKNFTGWSDEQMKSIQAPTLVLNANNDVGSVEHAVEMYRIMPHAQLVILPGGHGTYLGTAEYLDGGKWTQQYIVDIIHDFLKG